MVKKSVFISFDYDNDKDIWGSLRAHAADPQLAFNATDWSVKAPVTEKWKDEVRDRIQRVDLTIVLCGEHTDQEVGVAAEVTIAREELKPYLLLKGRKHKRCRKPRMALKSDQMQVWTQQNLKRLVAETK